MATMTMLVFEKDGVDLMLTEADAINRAIESGDIQADTGITLYLSDRSSAHKRAADHPQLAAFFAPEPEPDMPLAPVADPDRIAEPPSVSERLRALEADLDAGDAPWSNPAPPVAHAPPALQSYRLLPARPPQKKARKSRFIAAFLAAFLGVFGAHKFYLGKPRMGWLTLALFLIGGAAFTPLAQLVLLLVLVEAAIYIFQSDATFQSTVERDG